MQVIDPQGKSALGNARKTSGICGAHIFSYAKEFIQNAAKIIREEKLETVLLGVGGITLGKRFDEFLNMGADIAMCATGMMWDPYLALKWRQMHGYL